MEDTSVVPIPAARNVESRPSSPHPAPSSAADAIVSRALLSAPRDVTFDDIMTFDVPPSDVGLLQWDVPLARRPRGGFSPRPKSLGGGPASASAAKRGPFSTKRLARKARPDRSALPRSCRPVPYLQSVAYLDLIASQAASLEAEERLQASTSLRDGSNEAEVARIRAARRKRAEELKKRRIDLAKRNVSLGGGAGTRVRSSLMGLGGQDTEKSKRGSRKGRGGKGGAATTAVSHTDLCHDHEVARPELSRPEQRMFHRPRVTLKGCAMGRRWLLCRVHEKVTSVRR